MEPVEIAAGRLQLRPWSPHDALELAAAADDPDVARWTPLASPYTTEVARDFVDRVAPEGWEQGTTLTWAARDATTGLLATSVGLYRVEDGSAEIGYWTPQPARGSGLTTEAVAAVCRWAFGALGLQVLQVRVGVGNEASRAVAQKCGFAFEGVLRQVASGRGRRSDVWAGSLLAGAPMTDTRPLPAAIGLTDGVVALRRWRPADVPEVQRACDDPLTSRWLPVPVPYTLENAQGFLDSTVLAWVDGVYAETAVTDAADGELLGSATLKLRLRGNGVGEIGYWTAPWARGRGAAGRASALLAAWGLVPVADGGLGLHRVELHADVDNAASQAAALKAGFTREGVSRARYPDRDGVPHDMVTFARTRSYGQVISSSFSRTA